MFDKLLSLIGLNKQPQPGLSNQELMNRHSGSISNGFVSPVNPGKQFVEQAFAGMPRQTQAPQPTPTPTPNPNPYRHPRWNENRVKYPKNFEELLSGTGIASKKWDVPQDLLMDTALIESGGRPIPQHGNVPNGGQGYYQFEPPTLRGLGREDLDPYSATESADLAAELMSKHQLSRWGIPGGSWGSLDASRRNEADRLSTYYSPEELNRFLSSQYQF